MPRKTVYLGVGTRTSVDQRGPARPSWPDIDINGVVGDGGVSQLAGTVALTLGYETDWDLVRVYFSGGGGAPELLGPGRVLTVPQGSQVSRIEPVIAVPPTRLYDAANVRNGRSSPTSLPTGITIVAATPGSSSTLITNSGAADITGMLQWNGSKWVASVDTVWEAGTNLAPNGASAFIALDADLASGPLRAADFSFDGGVYSVADYIEAGLVPGCNAGVARVASTVFDAHGNDGDPTPGTTKRYGRYFQGGALSSYGPLSVNFFGRLAIDAWSDCAPREPRLAPSRYIELGAITVPHVGALADQALITFPVMNAKRVEWLLRNSGANDLYVALVSPVGADSITSASGVPDAEPAPAVQFLTINAGQEGSMVLDTPTHPLAKLLVGAAAGGTTIAAGSTLTIKRELDR
jgi:hypothetical protein